MESTEFDGIVFADDWREISSLQYMGRKYIFFACKGIWIAILISHLAAILIAFILGRDMDRSTVSRERITV